MNVVTQNVVFFSIPWSLYSCGESRDRAHIIWNADTICYLNLSTLSCFPKSIAIATTTGKTNRSENHNCSIIIRCSRICASIVIRSLDLFLTHKLSPSMPCCTYQAPRPLLIAMARYRALAARSPHDMLCLCTCMRQRLHVGRAVAGLQALGKPESRMHVQSPIQDASSRDREINLCCSGQWFSKLEAPSIKVNEPLSAFNTVTCIPERLICERRVCKTGTNMGM